MLTSKTFIVKEISKTPSGNYEDMINIVTHQQTIGYFTVEYFKEKIKKSASFASWDTEMQS